MSKALDRRLASTEEVRSGIGSSGFVDWLSNGRKGLYGSGDSRSAGGNDGISRCHHVSCYATRNYEDTSTVLAIYQITSQDKDVLDDICPLSGGFQNALPIVSPDQ